MKYMENYCSLPRYAISSQRFKFFKPYILTVTKQKAFIFGTWKPERIFFDARRTLGLFGGGGGGEGTRGQKLGHLCKMFFCCVRVFHMHIYIYTGSHLFQKTFLLRTCVNLGLCS